MNARLHTYFLRFEKPFKLSHGVRTGTDALFLSIEYKGETGYGEATFPPYLDEKPQKTQIQIAQIHFDAFEFEKMNSLEEIAAQLSTVKLSPFSRALVINTLADLQARAGNQTLASFCGIKNHLPAYKACLTVTKNDLSSLPQKLKPAKNFSHLKLKLDGDHDLEFVSAIRYLTDKPFCADANQGWETMEFNLALSNAQTLSQMGCELLEQPFAKTSYEKHRLLKNAGVIPVFADESIQDLSDLEHYGYCFDGINVKLLKCGGIDKAIDLCKNASLQNLAVIIGCMSESACGCATSLALASMANYLDIDGPWLISNNPFDGLTIKNGIFETQGQTGIGVKPNQNL